MNMIFTPQPLRAVGVLFSPMLSGWAGGWVAGKSLSGLYLINLWSDLDLTLPQ